MGQISQMARRSPPPPPQPLAEIESPTQQRQTPAQFFSSLPRPLAHPSLSLTSAATGAVTLSSPLKRTLSSNSHSVSGIRPPTVLARPTLPPNGDESEEVPTEPEPESDTETPSLLPQTPENQRIKRPALLAQESSMARKSVRFGPALSPEVFDAGAPPATPLRRGTLMQMAGRVASILRRGASPTRLAPLLETSPLRSLLTPRPSRRQAMHRHLARLAKDVDDEEERKGGDPGSPPSDLGSLSVIDIESPTVLGVSPADRRQRRRRSVRLSGGRRATLDSPLRSAGFKSSPVRANRPSPPPVLSLSEQRRERRRTAPPVIGDLATSMAQMAEALGEDVPVIFGSTPMAAEPVAAEPMAAEESAPVVEPLGLAEAMRQELDEKEEIEDEEEAVAESSSLAVLLEQAERQARIQGSSPDASMAGSDSLAVSCKLAGLSVTSPPPTPAAPAFDAKQTRKTFDAKQTRKSRRQTIGIPAREEEEEEEEEEGSVDEILARRRALRRIQERKRRRQTVADLNKRRSSWRGWAAPGVGGVSPPSSPIISQSASHVDSTKPHVPCEKSHSSFPLTALSSTASASASAIMYPPPAWNNMERDTPAKSRGIVGIVAGALGMTRKNSLNSGVELAEDPKHGATPSFAYPPRPVPIDADWETVEAPVDDERLPSTVSEKDEPELTQQVELYAVSRPGSETGGDYLCQLGSAPTETNPDESTVVPEPVQEPEKPHSVVSPPATRGRTGRQQSSESSVSPSKQTRKSVGRHHSAAAVTVTTTASRKRRADDSTTLAAQPAAKRPAPKPTTQVAAKRGRGRPPNKNTAGRSAVEPQTFVISPPATRSSKRAKPPNLNH
ncbi:hypothetical protein GGI20_005247 [Coemansia sp. BCRC 34301]|nr:hypothetical protein GGI20_005247 [Coemansia sp. BCRC 34301]